MRSYYFEDIATFLNADPHAILGNLAKGESHDLSPQQRAAWSKQIAILYGALSGQSEGKIGFEYFIPRMGKRVDNILIIADIVFVIEFKIGAIRYDAAAVDQVVDYALDLKNFHEASATVSLLPILVATDAPNKKWNWSLYRDQIAKPALANSETLRSVLRTSLEFSVQTKSVDAEQWYSARYKPTPTIIEASQRLYQGHSVTEIARSEAGVDNLDTTTNRLVEIIEKVKSARKKALCLVTGVPGAGKTLAGLNLASERRRVDKKEDEHAVFLSGNGPLVAVLQEALARNQVEQAKLKGVRSKKNDALREVKAFIQNVHHFRDDAVASNSAPIERVVIFDEAQRAWDQTQTSKFMRQKRGVENFQQSEPEFLLRVIDRHNDWCVVICLIGSGQEINTGEAGTREWIRSVISACPHWQIFMPPSLLIECQGDDDLLSLNHEPVLHHELHLGVCVRSFRSERLHAAVAAILDCDQSRARQELLDICEQYPIAITRSLEVAKDWVRRKARGSERYGLLASSGGRRLKPEGIHVDNKADPKYWFLNSKQDVRSSYYLEDPATEFEVQGLEVDWAIVAWDIDLAYSDGTWIYQAFKGARWQQIRIERDRRYRLNSYRVLLTRARQGMVILIPEGSQQDHTRPPFLYDSIWEYFLSLDLSVI